MSKSTLTSVNKEHLDNILDGIKTIEWRKKPLPLGKHYGYETKHKGGCGKVTGEFEVVQNIKFNLYGDTYRPHWLAKGCVPYEFLVEYANGAEYLYANVIENAKRYDKPKELSEFRKPCPYTDGTHCLENKCEYYDDYSGKCCCRVERPPQSWSYVEELQDK